MIFLFWIDSGSSYRVVGSAFDTPRNTVCRIVHKYLKLFVKILPEVIRRPSNETEIAAVSEGFKKLSKCNAFVKCLGAIDGSHIWMTAPKDLAGDYYNRKHKTTVQLQAIVDHRGLFLDIFCGFPGSVHDMRVLRHSTIYQSGHFPPRNYFIIGDQGYRCITNPLALISPYRTALTEQQLRFNNILSKARIIVEQAFGWLKGRWRCLHDSRLRVNYKKVPHVVSVCCILHNLCVLKDDLPPQEYYSDYDESEEYEAVEEIEGDVFLNSICNQITSAYNRYDEHNYLRKN